MRARPTGAEVKHRFADWLVCERQLQSWASVLPQALRQTLATGRREVWGGLRLSAARLIWFRRGSARTEESASQQHVMISLKHATKTDGDGSFACASHPCKPKDTIWVVLDPIHELPQYFHSCILHATGVLRLSVVCGIMNAPPAKS